MDFAEFILAHEADDLARLALSRDRYAAEVEDFDMALTTLEVRRKLRLKVPEWYAVPSLRYPFRLSGEQCSSAETASYKAAVASVAGGRIADLTGGLGVDSWAFSKVAAAVLYNEMKPELAAAAEHNFRELGVENVTVRNCRLEPGNVGEVLDGFEPDIIFLDPARRSEDGRKVFRLEDCQPDVLQLLPELFSAAPLILLKLSPMADITLVCRQLGSVREVHVVASDGECKELLLLLERGYEGNFTTVIYENGSIIQAVAEGGVLKPMATLGLVRGRGPKLALGGVGAADGLTYTYLFRRLPVTSNPVIITHHYQRSAVTGLEEGEVFIGLKGGELTGERQNLRAVNAGGGKESLFLLQGREQPEVPGVLLQDRPWMRPERNHNGLLSPFTGRGDHCLKHTTVPKMDTVKESCSYYSHFTHSKLWRCASSGCLANTRAPTRYAPVFSGRRVTS